MGDKQLQVPSSYYFVLIFDERRIFDPADMPDGTIDIPVWAQDTKQYCGSLAHKCNHSFTPNGEKYFVNIIYIIEIIC